MILKYGTNAIEGIWPSWLKVLYRINHLAVKAGRDPPFYELADMLDNAEGGYDEIYESGATVRHIHVAGINWTHLHLPENGEYDKLADQAADQVFHEELDEKDGDNIEEKNKERGIHRNPRSGQVDRRVRDSD